MLKIYACHPLLQVHETFETSQVGSSSRAANVSFCCDDFEGDFQDPATDMQIVIFTWTGFHTLIWPGCIDYDKCVWVYIYTYASLHLWYPHLDCFALNLINWGNAHLNSFSKAVERGAGAWLRAVQLMEGIKGANLEPSLPTNNVPCEWRHWR